MQVLRDLTRQQIVAILSIIIIVATSLWVWQVWDNQRTKELHTEEYKKLEEENQLLRYEIDNLKKQNQLLHEIIGLKRKLE